jgi:aspartyl-tRNA(Asn)/glutamyl-tRNA(Gln) amidotransferase subunit C
MSNINRDVVAHLEKLARIKLAPDEVEAITAQLDRIVALVESLQSVDVTGVEPTQGMSHERSAEGEHVRADEVTPGLERAIVLEQAPDATREFFRVPRVIGRDEES